MKSINELEEKKALALVSNIKANIKNFQEPLAKQIH